ncbi:hypothetical protein [Tepidiphilus sp. J10]|nr:hypothetical protein [Tepidiphilus sp. J10]
MAYLFSGSFKVFDAAQDVPEPLDIFILPNYRTFLFCLARG